MSAALVLIVALDGVARTDAYNADMMPHVAVLRSAGRDYPNTTTGNPYGVSLPAYADVFMGARVDRVRSNGDAFLLVGAKVHATVYTSWAPLCAMVDCVQTENDTQTLASALVDIRSRKSGTVFVHLLGADKEAHLAGSISAGKGVDVGRGGYEAELRKSDAYVRRLWNAAATTGKRSRMIVFTDHGRSANWRDHGSDVRSSRAWCFVVGDGVRAGVDEKEITLSAIGTL